MSVDFTFRTPNFMEDVNTYGKAGERFFMSVIGNKLEARGEKVYDVSQNPFWQKIDIDFVVSKEGKELVDNFETVRDPSFLKMEIKVDTRCHDTGNLPFEVISHGRFGWSINTHADKVLIVACKDGFENGLIYAYEAYMVDMYKWKVFASYSSNSFRDPNKISNEEIYDFLHKIDAMKDAGVITNVIQINSWI